MHLENSYAVFHNHELIYKSKAYRMFGYIKKMYLKDNSYLTKEQYDRLVECGLTFNIVDKKSL